MRWPSQLVGQLHDGAGGRAQSQTRVAAARVVGCGTRVHTFPDALATSMAPTRSRTSQSSTSISWLALASHPLVSIHWDRTPGGLGQGTENLIRRARSNSARPFWSGPGVRLTNGFDYQGSVGVAGVPTPFSRRHDAPARERGD